MSSYADIDSWDSSEALLLISSDHECRKVRKYFRNVVDKQERSGDLSPVDIFVNMLIW